MNKFTYSSISTLSLLVGSVSLITFFAFVLFGALNIVDLGLDNTEIILVNTILSLVFFVQHSLMIRDSVQSEVTKIIPNELFYAVYSVVSGVMLLLIIILWQESPSILMSITEPYIYLLRAIQFASILGLVWAVKSLSNFDPFGRKQISKFINNQKEAQGKLIYSGAYNYIRHPFYFFILIMIWTYPVISADRLLFICLWTIWIVLGTFLEEKDLVNQIGDEYLEYKKRVPMLIPYKVFGHR